MIDATIRLSSQGQRIATFGRNFLEINYKFFYRFYTLHNLQYPPLFDCICPGLSKISGKKSSGPWSDMILPSDKNLPAVSASSDCCHFGVIVCVIHLQIFAFKKRKVDPKTDVHF